MADRRVILGSASPRRSDLLSQLGVQFDVVVPDIDERQLDGESAIDYVQRLAGAKSAAIRAADDDVIITADTTVELDGEVLGKPVDTDDAAAMLRRLSARTHHVHSGVALRVDGVTHVEVSTSMVTFVALDERTIEWYLATKEPFDKAGAYAIQGAGGALVQRVQGSVSGIIGLPTALLLAMARRAGVRLVG